MQDIRVVTISGIPLQEPIVFQIRGVIFRIPAGYLWPWPKQAVRHKVNETTQVDFDFWMPARRYLEVDTFSYVGFRPKERGRDPPSSYAYVVKVRQFQPGIRADDPDYLSPQRAFENFTSRPGPSSYSFRDEMGLRRFWRNDWPYSRPEPLYHYRHIENSDPQVLFRCTLVTSTLRYPSCDGEVFFVHDELGFHIQFLSDNLTDWRNIVEAVRDLATKWKSTL